MIPLWLLVLVAETSQFATAAFLPTLPAIAQTFGVTVQSVQIGVTVYILAYAIGQAPAGLLADRIGRRRVTLAGAAVYAGAAGAAALATGLPGLVALRALEGLGAGVLFVTCRAALRDVASGAALTRGMALISMWTWLCGGAAALLAGLVQDRFGWRATLLLVAAYGVLVLAVAALRLPETLPGRAAGTVRAGPAAPAGWRSFVPVLRARAFWRHAGASSAMIGAFYAFLTGGPAILIGRLGVAAGLLGLFQLAAVAAFCVSAFAAARLARGRRAGLLIPAGLLVAAGAATGLLAAGWTGALTPGIVAACLVVLAVGAGLVMPPTLAGAVDPFPDRAGAASAASALLQTAGAGLGSALASLPGDAVLTVPAAMLGLVVLAALFQALPARAAAARAISVPVPRHAADPGDPA